MAWIKMRTDLLTHPKLVRILSALRPHDIQTVTDKFRVIGGLHAVWSVFDTHSTDGRLVGYTPDLLDEVIGWKGFSQAMMEVEWLHYDGAQTVDLPEFSEHNGQSAKRRAEDQKRKASQRKESEDDPKIVRIKSGQKADKKRTREREDSKQPPIPPDGGQCEGEEDIEGTPKKRKPAIGLKAYLQNCKDSGAKPIPDEDTVFDYAQEAGIPSEFLELHWREFLDRYREPDAKRYRDWRCVFRKSVRGNWFRLWYFDASDDCRLTSVGVQAKNLHDGKVA